MQSGYSRRGVLPKFSDRLSLGDSGLAVSSCCVGIVRAPETISVAFDAGINFFFVTADMHWPLYENIRRGLADLLARGRHMRERIVVAGVAYVTQPEFCSMPFQELLEAVPGLGHLDVLIAGGVYAAEFPTRLAVYTEHRQRRFVGSRAIGASFHERRAAISAIRDNVIDLALIRYNAAHPKARQDLFPAMSPDRRTTVFNFKSTNGYVSLHRFAELGLDGGDYWQPSITDHYRFVMSRPEIDGMLIAPSTPEHVNTLAEALDEGPLSEEEQAHMINLAAVDRGDARPIEKD